MTSSEPPPCVAMKILLQAPRDEGDAWHAALVAALPEATIAVWPDTLHPIPITRSSGSRRPSSSPASGRARRSSIWAPASTFCSASPTLPEGIPVIRLEDAGMAEQMAEYVTLAVLRAYREVGRVRGAAARRSLATAPAARRSRQFGVGILGFGVLGQAVADGARAVRFPASRLERDAQGGSGRPVVRGRGRARSFLASSRVLVCLLPSTPETRDLLDRANLSRSCRAARISSTSRAATSSSTRICRAARRRPSRRRDARRVSRRAAARRAIRSGIIRGSR